MSPVNFNGLRVFDYTVGHSLSSSLAVIEVGRGVHHAEAWWRRSDKCCFVSAGEIRFVLDGEAFVMTAGDFCCVARGRRFSDANHGSDVATLVLVHTPPFDVNEEVFLNDVPGGPSDPTDRSS